MAAAAPDGSNALLSADTSSSSLAVIAWPHTSNFSAEFLSDPQLLSSKLKSMVLCTEKLDGSNLSLRVRRVLSAPAAGGGGGGNVKLGDWSIVAFQGRGSLAWQPSTQPFCLPTAALAASAPPTEGGAAPPRKAAPSSSGIGQGIPNFKYGNAGALGALPDLIYRFCVAVLNDSFPTATEAIVFGEAFKAKGQKAASWHPFGLIVLQRSDADASGSLPQHPRGPGGAHPAGTAPAVVETGAAAGEDGEGGEDDLPAGAELHVLDKRLHDIFTRQAAAIHPELRAAAACSGAATAAPPATGEKESAGSGGTLGGVPPGGAPFQLWLAAHAAARHYVIPPQVLFHGPLDAAVRALRPFLATAAPEVEGTFIAGNGLYFKWKTPAHEEQLKAQTALEVGVFLKHFRDTGRLVRRTQLPEMLSIYEAAAVKAAIDAGRPPLSADDVARDLERIAFPSAEAREVFDAVVGLFGVPKATAAAVTADKKNGGQAAPSAADVALRGRILTAFQREATKEPALALDGSGLPSDPGSRKKVAERVIASIVTEVTQLMTVDGEKPPAAAALKKDVQNMVLPVIMSGDLSRIAKWWRAVRKGDREGREGVTLYTLE